MNTSNPIPDNIRPITAIGVVLPPFVIVILAFLWFRLGTSQTIIMGFAPYALLTLVPLILHTLVCRIGWRVPLPGSRLITAFIFWALAVGPLAVAIVTLETVELQIALALPLVLISGFYMSATMYLLTALAHVVASFRAVPAPAAVGASSETL